MRAWRAANLERSNALMRKRLLSTFGLTPADYDRLLVEQNGVCAICRQPETARHGKTLRSLAVDHCHTTNRVRGLLCQACNLSLGKMQDDPLRLRAAADYVERNR